MSELSDAFLSRLHRRRIFGLDLPVEFVVPDTDGGSILNLPLAVCRWLGAAPISGYPALAEELLLRIGSGFRRVIVVLIDALSYRRLASGAVSGRLGVGWSRLAERGLLAPLTSITPSTTSAALTTLWTGRAPGEHGIVGYELFLKEYGIVVNTIQHKPIVYSGDAGSLERAGFQPEHALSVSTLGTHLAGHGVRSFAFQPAAIARSGLSRMLMKDCVTVPFITASDLWVSMRRRIEAQPAERMYLWAYWGEVDTLGHFYGPDDERIQAELAAFGDALLELLIRRLDPALAGETLLVVTADHGQIQTEPDPHYDLRNHAGLTRRLHLLPTGEHRLAYLYIRPGQTEAVREYIQRTWPHQFCLIDPPYAVDAGLFGEGDRHPRLLERLGDLAAAARGGAYFWWADRENNLFGRHGGLSEDEMLVPLLAGRISDFQD